MTEFFRFLKLKPFKLPWVVSQICCSVISIFLASTDIVAQELSSQVRKVTLSTNIESDGQLIPFDLGKHLPGSKLNAFLQLTNKTGKSLILFLKPSCNCTELSVDKLEFAVGGTETIRFDMVSPRSGVTTAYIKCKDENSLFESSIGLKVEAAQPVKLERDRLIVDSRSGDDVTVALEPTSKEYSVAEIELELGSRWTIQKVSLANGIWAVGLHRIEKVSEGYHEEYLRLNCKVRDEHGDSAYVPLDFRILYSDRFRLGPSYVIPKKTVERVSFVVFATGVNVTKNELAAKLWITNEDLALRTEVAIENTRIRSGSLLLEAGMSADSFSQLIQKSEGRPLSLELSFGNVTSSTKLQAESLKDPS